MPSILEPASKRALRNILGLLPFDMKITGRRRDLGLSVMDRLYPPPPGAQMEKISTSDGRQFLVDLSACNQRLLSCYYGNLLRHYRASPLNRVIIDVASRRGPPGTFLDVGSNLGLYSLLAREAGFDPVLVEAEPGHGDFLKRHPELYPTVFAVAVGDAESIARFFVSESNPGGNSLVSEAPGNQPAGEERKPSLYQATIDVRVRRLDALLSELPDQGAGIGMIKIDVEGFEGAVVRGMTGYLGQGHRPVIWCEVRGPDSDRTPNSYRTVCDTLGAYGYRAFWGERPGQGAFDEGDGPLPQVFDLLFRASAPTG
ncbi:FkbM family methyltransferase [Marinobacter sp. M1N3S26]|uniref:FkbM family methyltransferase n=1 Tax=unclassified Marinobacter TaxID=83889 RepID=UPI00387B5752